MRPQIFASPALLASIVGLLAACGTNPADDEPVASDTGTDTVDAEPDAVDVGSDAVDTGSDTSVDVVPDTVDVGDPDIGDPDTAEDVGPDLMEDVQPDALERLTLRGWFSNADEHSGFIPEDEINNASFDAGCNAYLIPLDDGERWWTATREQVGLALHPAPHAVGYERVGLIEATGVVTSNGPTGHFGQYDRDFELEESTLFACETVERMPHCLTPRTDDLCFGGFDIEGLTVRHELVEMVPGMIGNQQLFELRITTGENVGDGRTDIVLHFTLERSEDLPEDDRYNYPVGQIQVTHAIFELHGFAYQEVPFEVRNADGWMTLDRSDASIELSLDLAREDGASVNVWGDFPITDTVFMP